MYVPAEYQKRELWRKKFPTVIGALLSVFEMILTFAIVGCEAYGTAVDFYRMNAFVGYGTFPFFMIAWISVAGASCCCRIHCCGVAAVVFQCLAIPMALCVIGFDAYFLNNPTQCFFSTSCSYYTSSYYTYYYGLSSNSTLYGVKVPLVQGQLAAGVLMFVACIVFIIIFAVVNYKVENAPELKGPASIIPQPAQYATPYAHPPYRNSLRNDNLITQPPVINPIPPPYVAVASPPTDSPVPKNELICYNCRTRFKVST